MLSFWSKFHANTILGFRFMVNLGYKGFHRKFLNSPHQNKKALSPLYHKKYFWLKAFLFWCGELQFCVIIGDRDDQMSWINLTGVISEKPKGECGRKDERCIRLKRHNTYRGDHWIILLVIRQKGESQNVGFCFVEFCVGFCFLVITFWDSPFCLITKDLFTYYWPETFYKNFHIKRLWNFSPCLFFFRFGLTEIAS